MKIIKKAILFSIAIIIFVSFVNMKEVYAGKMVTCSTCGCAIYPKCSSLYDYYYPGKCSIHTSISITDTRWKAQGSCSGIIKHNVNVVHTHKRTSACGCYDVKYECQY